MRYFDFGENWTNFSQNAFSKEKIDETKESILKLIDKEAIKDKTFIDVGCGSGLFTISACSLGASQSTGIDISPKCIQAAISNAEKYFPEKKIIFKQQSILDKFDSNIKYDIVYSWGVLHHTGKMWEAIKNTTNLVSDKGLLVIAIYNKHWSSKSWNFIKRIYNLSPKIVKKLMIYLFYAVIFIAKFLVTFKNPLNKKRGMNFYYDVIDWVGGYPYEYASKNEIQDFVENLGYTLIKYQPATVPTGCNEFVFKKI